MRRYFTLIEVLVAMAVFLVGISPLLGLLSSVTLNHVEYMNEKKVSGFFEHKIREILDAGKELESVGLVTAIEADEEGVFYEIRVNDSINTPSENKQDVWIRVGTAANLKIKPFINPLDGEDDRVTAEIKFLNIYKEKLP